VAVVARRGGAETRPEQTVWPTLILGFVIGAGLATYGGGAGEVLLAGGVSGGVLGYLAHCWRRPFAECWWPTWLRGCRNRPVTPGKYYRMKKPCPLHPNNPHYRRVGARVLGRGLPKE
jgi:hypothetical protein